MNRPLASVIITSYNYERFIGKAIQSVLNQSYPNIEIIVVDDGSTDDSRKVIESFGNRVTAVFKENGGQASSLNKGFEISRGEFLFFLDSDDYYLPDAIDHFIDCFSDDVVMVQSKLNLVDDQENIFGVYPSKSLPLASGDVAPLLVKNGFLIVTMTSGIAFRRSALQKILPLDEEKFFLSPDGYFVNTLPFMGKCGAIGEPKACHRVHGINAACVAVDNSIVVPRLRRAIAWAKNENEIVYANAQKYGFNRPRYADCRMHSFNMTVRLASLLWDRQNHPYSSDMAWFLCVMGIKGMWTYQFPLELKLRKTFWFLLLGISPTPFKRSLIEMQLMPDKFKTLVFLKRVVKQIFRRV